MTIILGFPILCFTFLVQAQENLSVQITEIAPHKIQEEAEWWEFRVKGEEGRFETWQVRDGKGRTKAFLDVKDQLLWDPTVEVLDPEKLHFSLPQGEGSFSWTVSPLALPNNGGSLEILDESGTILSKAEYPKLKSGTRDKSKYAEIWTREPDHGLWYPHFYHWGRTRHSKLRKNLPAPLFPQDIELIISEVGMLREEDFVELQIQNLSKGSQKPLPLMIKHNGSVIYSGTPQLKEDQYFMMPARKGLSGGSGTIEVITWEGTSWETTLDAACYQKGDLSQSEEKRVKKWLEQGLWSGDCFDISGFSNDVSLARIVSKSDTNTASDWIPHVHGSPGATNKNQNRPPRAEIRLQRNFETIREIPFSVNVTGEGSSDPDGEGDIVRYAWMVNGEWFTGKSNPGYYRITEPGTYVFQLSIMDLSGLSDQTELVIEAVEKGSKKQETGNKLSSTDKNQPSHLPPNQLFTDPFFADFQKQFSETKDHRALASKNLPLGPSQASVSPYRTAREKLIHWDRLEGVASNLGQIFLEN